MTVSTEEPALLDAHSLKVIRGRRLLRRTVLSDIRLKLHAGEVVMLIGPNGAGKTTLLETLAGDLPVHSGQMYFAGRLLTHWPLGALARHRAVLRQQTRLNLDFSANEVVALGCQSRSGTRAWRETLVANAMAMTGVSHLAQRSVLSLSGGEQARVHLARVFAQLWPDNIADFGDQSQAEALMPQPPRLLLLDEPCASLDPRFQHHVCQIVRDFAAQSGSAVVITMHDMNLAAQYADRILLLQEGRIVKEGAPRQVLERTTIQECFNVDSERIQAEHTLMMATRALE
ncbi:heme ABC transporter ATP-binding protein [Marinimicrobium sp. ARAG 43.8]|uniref:heme ABC transporter ATP-binding protein n=1 Tax=Marinimicrobium sp. ARAG 43.8 TaxID=3418719 RepID=UPI003CEF25FD